MQTIRAAIREGTRVLAGAGVPDPGRDARRLMCHLLGLDGARLFAVEDDPLESPASEQFAALIARRATRQPLSQITGARSFYGRNFTVTPDVLDPRPETETLIDIALSAPFDNVLDLGTGTGAILITLLADRLDARGVGSDVSPAALAIAGENALEHGVEDRIVLTVSDWWQDVGGSYDLIVSNPPYIAKSEMADLAPEVRDWEPRAALTDEADGLNAYRRIVPGALKHLVPGGRLILEIGATQGPDVLAIMRKAAFVAPRLYRDLGGHDRVVAAQKPEE